MILLQKKEGKRWLVSILHAIALLIVTLIYLRLPFTLNDEVALIEVTSGVKNILFGKQIKPPKDSLAFINVAWEKQLIPKYDNNGFPIGYIDITNRKSLGKLVWAFNKMSKPYKFLVIDIRFYLESEDDSLLSNELKKVKNCLVSYHKDANHKPEYPIFDAPLGLSDMLGQMQDDMILKYHIIQNDSLKTTPLLMYEQIHKDTIVRGSLFDELNGNVIFDSFIMDHPVRPYDLFVKKKYPYYQLSDLMSIPDDILLDIVNDYFQDRIIMIGDFENTDIHKTIYGPMPGPIILLNAYLCLKNSYNKVSIFFILFLFVFFTIISYKALTVKDPVTRFLERKFPNKNSVLQFFMDVTFYLGYFGFVSVLSYFLFNIHLTILFLSFYMSFLEKGLFFLYKRKLKKLKTS